MKEIEDKKELVGNIVIMGVAMIVTAAVTIAVIAGADSSKQSPGNMKTLLSVCSITENPDICYRSLKHAGERGTVMNYVKASVDASLRELMVVVSPKPDQKRLTPLQAQSLKDCLGLLVLGMEELISLCKLANSTDDPSKVDVDDVMNSLSAVVSYQQICSDEFLRTNTYAIFGYSLKRPLQLTRMTLAIAHNFLDQNVTEIASLTKLSLRRLLGTTDLGNAHHTFPTWFSAAERQLLESKRNGGKKPNAVVAADGTGQFSTISGAVNACPNNKKGGPCIIHVKEGKYKERVVVPRDMQVFMYGDGPKKTIVRGIHISQMKERTTFQTATFVVMGKGFICKDMSITAPYGIEEAPALIVLSDHSAFFNCKIVGQESSLFAAAQRQFYRRCKIYGSVDIIKGDSATVIQNSQIIITPQICSGSYARKNVVTAQSRIDKHETTGFVIQNCSIKADRRNTNVSLAGTAYLGTPYKEYSRTIIMESSIEDVIHPEGWCKRSDNYGIESAFFREYNNQGPGAKTEKRVHWQAYRTVRQKDQLVSFTAGPFLQADRWLQTAHIPYAPGFVSQK